MVRASVLASPDAPRSPLAPNRSGGTAGTASNAPTRNPKECSHVHRQDGVAAGRGGTSVDYSIGRGRPRGARGRGRSQCRSKWPHPGAVGLGLSSLPLLSARMGSRPLARAWRRRGDRQHHRQRGLSAAARLLLRRLRLRGSLLLSVGLPRRSARDLRPELPLVRVEHGPLHDLWWREAALSLPQVGGQARPARGRTRAAHLAAHGRCGAGVLSALWPVAGGLRIMVNDSLMAVFALEASRLA